jgi:hypothetical protein
MRWRDNIKLESNQNHCTMKKHESGVQFYASDTIPSFLDSPMV